MVANVVPPPVGRGPRVRRGGRQTSASVLRGPLPSRWSLSGRRPLATGTLTTGMQTSEAPAGMCAFMSSNAAESAWSRGSDDSFNAASTSGPHPGAPLPSRHRVTGAVQLPPAAPSASQASPSVHRTTPPCPLHPVTAATRRHAPLRPARRWRVPAGFTVVRGGPGSVVVVVAVLGGTVVDVVVALGGGFVVVVVLGLAPSSGRRRGRWAGIWLSREEYFARFVLPFL